MEAEGAALLSEHRQKDVLPDGQGVEKLVDLIAFAHAHLADLRYADAGDIAATQENLAAGGFDFTGQHLEECGLAGAVRTDKAAQLAFLNRDGHTLHRLEPAIVFGSSEERRVGNECVIR